MGINAQVEDLKNKIIEAINQAGLPICMVDYVTTEIANQVKLDYMAQVQAERDGLENPPAVDKEECLQGFKLMKGETA